jgi:hypothetical protein
LAFNQAIFSSGTDRAAQDNIGRAFKGLTPKRTLSANGLIAGTDVQCKSVRAIGLEYGLVRSAIPALGDPHIIVCGVEFGNRKQFAGEDIEGRFAVAAISSK